MSLVTGFFLWISIGVDPTFSGSWSLDEIASCSHPFLSTHPIDVRSLRMGSIGYSRPTSTSLLRYGCHCGLGGASSQQVLDPLDRCCFKHETCIENARKNVVVVCPRGGALFWELPISWWPLHPLLELELAKLQRNEGNASVVSRKLKWFLNNWRTPKLYCSSSNETVALNCDEISRAYTGSNGAQSCIKSLCNCDRLFIGCLQRLRPQFYVRQLQAALDRHFDQSRLRSCGDCLMLLASSKLKGGVLENWFRSGDWVYVAGAADKHTVANDRCVRCDNGKLPGAWSNNRSSSPTASVACTFNSRCYGPGDCILRHGDSCFICRADTAAVQQLQCCSEELFDSLKPCIEMKPSEPYSVQAAEFSTSEMYGASSTASAILASVLLQMSPLQSTDFEIKFLQSLCQLFGNRFFNAQISTTNQPNTTQLAVSSRPIKTAQLFCARFSVSGEELLFPAGVWLANAEARRCERCSVGSWSAAGSRDNVCYIEAAAQKPVTGSITSSGTGLSSIGCYWPTGCQLVADNSYGCISCAGDSRRTRFVRCSSLYTPACLRVDRVDVPGTRRVEEYPITTSVGITPEDGSEFNQQTTTITILSGTPSELSTSSYTSARTGVYGLSEQLPLSTAATAAMATITENTVAAQRTSTANTATTTSVTRTTAIPYIVEEPLENWCFRETRDGTMEVYGEGQWSFNVDSDVCEKCVFGVWQTPSVGGAVSCFYNDQCFGPVQCLHSADRCLFCSAVFRTFIDICKLPKFKPQQQPPLCSKLWPPLQEEKEDVFAIGDHMAVMKSTLNNRQQNASQAVEDTANTGGTVVKMFSDVVRWLVG